MIQRFPSNKCVGCNNAGMAHCSSADTCGAIKESVIIDDVINLIKSKKANAENHLVQNIPATVKLHIEGKIMAYDQILNEL